MGGEHARALTLALMVCHLAIAFALHGGVAARSGDDYDRYWEIAGAAGRPYVSYQVELAPLAPGFFRLVARTTGDRDNFRRVLLWTMATADLAIALCLVWGFGWSSAAIYLVITGPLLTLYFMRADFLPTAAAALAAAAYRRGKPLVAAAALVTGVGFKLWPLPLAAWFVRRWRTRDGRRAALGFAAGAAILGLSWMVIGGAGGVGQVVTFRGATGWQVESLIGAALAAGGGLTTLRLESDAWRVGVLSPTVTIALLALGTLVAFGLVWRGASARDHMGVTWLAGVTALMLSAPILSPQYLVWIAPATAIAWTEGHRRASLLAAAAVPLTMLLMRGYGALLAQQSWAAWLIIGRNLALLLSLLAAVAAIWQIRRRILFPPEGRQRID